MVPGGIEYAPYCMANEKTIRCPRDGGRMEQERIGSVRIDRCPQCGGIWLDKGELEQVVKSAEPRAVQAEVDIGAASGAKTRQRVGHIKCPRDGKDLRVKRHDAQAHVEIDQCDSCGGAFLEAGELADLSEFTLLERMKTLLSRS